VLINVDTQVDLSSRQPALSDGVINLRPWAYGDLGCVREASVEGIVPEGTTVPVDYSETAGREFVERQWSRTSSGQGWSLAIANAATDEALGCAVLLLRRQAQVAGIGYWLMPAARGFGYAARAVSMLTDWGLGAGGLERIEAWVEPVNVASASVLERCGYQCEGRLRSFLSFPTRRADALVFSRIRTAQQI
jgi:ribosomal-protein-alanine N-acetyltransferase